MGAYAALLSLMHTMDHIRNHPLPPISLQKTQADSLTKNVTFLQEFLEDYSHHAACYTKEPDSLQSRIAAAAYSAEDVIESHIVDQILAGTTKRIMSVDFNQDLEKVTEEMESITKEAMEIKEKMGQMSSAPAPADNSPTSSSLSRGTKTAMVGFDNILFGIMDKLTGGELDRQVIPITGMGGIGKTTLARNIYQHEVVVQHFDILIWVTISQQYKLGEVLLELLQGSGVNSREVKEHELGDKLRKRLWDRRYLIVLDDIWDIEVWDRVKLFFPSNNNGSSVILTTRLSNLSSHVSNSHVIHMDFLNEGDSWKLFSKTVFGEEGCPLEFEDEIGKNIVKKCKGLPLSIVVIGGLLAKSKHTREYWEFIAENLNSIVNLEDNESCLKILRLSYNELPVYLKPCFLYMGVFPEDSVVRASNLVKLWVDEGFLKPISGKSSELTAKEYLKELIDRNLVLVAKFGSTGNIKYCNMHDLVRDLCTREAQKERFYSEDTQKDINTHRRLVIHNKKKKKDTIHAFQSKARSLVCKSENQVLTSENFRLLRVLETFDICDRPYVGEYSLETIFQLVNMRYLNIVPYPNSGFPSSVNLVWNLRTLIFKGFGNAPVEIWSMTRLKHIEFRGLRLPDPPGDEVVLKNLQTLVRLLDLKCGEGVIKRIPNVMKLSLEYTEFEGNTAYFLQNLGRLHKLESLSCFSCHPPPEIGDENIFFPHSGFLQNLMFPQSLKKLTLDACRCQCWDYMMEKIGSLPLLEKLKINWGCFRGGKWETIDGQFCRLKFLQMECCDGLEYWIAESCHFPCLEHLVLDSLLILEEIPPDFKDIPTLESIFIKWCSYSAVVSAKKMQDAQEEESGEVSFQVRVSLKPWDKIPAYESLAAPNFQVRYR